MIKILLGRDVCSHWKINKIIKNICFEF